MAKPIGVIGGGLGGLAAACVLAARGHRVVLFESNSWLGGKAAVLRANGFRFDMGPTILTLPSVLARIFAEAGKDVRQELDLIPLDPQWRCFFNDGSVLDLEADLDRMAARLRQYSPTTASDVGYRRFLEWSRRLHAISDRYFFWKPVGGLGDAFDARTTFRLSTLRDVLDLRMGQTVARSIRRYVTDSRVAQMLDHFTQYVGSNPEQSPAVLCGIAHMQTSEGVWYPRGGTRAVPEALERLARELGVEIRTNVGIRRIVTSSANHVTALETDAGEHVDVAAVVSNMDAVRTHRELLGGRVASAFERQRHCEPACSGVVLFLGLRKRYDHLLHHNFVFSRSPEEEFDAIYHKGEPAEDPTCYVCAPAATEPEVAPDGGEALYVLVHTPYLRPHHDWRAMLPRYRKTIIDKLATTGGMSDLESRIVFESVLTPQDIHQRYRVLQGAIYGLASHGRFVGAFKPGNRSPLVKGLYLAGGSAHPGPGMPMALMSGWIAADTLDRDGLAEQPYDRVALNTQLVKSHAHDQPALG
jgi:phytoene desaturase